MNREVKIENRFEIQILGTDYSNKNYVVRVVSYSGNEIINEVKFEIKEGDKITLPYTVKTTTEVY